MKAIVTLTNCTVSGNSAGVEGGGLFSSYGTSTLANCTVSAQLRFLRRRHGDL